MTVQFNKPSSSANARPSGVAASQPRIRAVCARCAAAPSLEREKTGAAQTKTLALKEWSVTIGALSKAKQTVLFRKGGIREPTFKPEAKDFVMFPTAFHTTTSLLKPQYAQTFDKEKDLDPKASPVLPLDTWCQVTGAWTCQDPRVLQLLDDFHVWTPQYLETRLKWRSSSPLTLMEVRAWHLDPPLNLDIKEDYFGCFSWVDLSSAVSDRRLQEGARPVMSDDEFAERQQRLRQQLTLLDVQQLDL